MEWAKTYESQLCCQHGPARTNLSFSSVNYRAPGCLVSSSGLGDDHKSHWQTGRQAFKSHMPLIFSSVIQ